MNAAIRAAVRAGFYYNLDMYGIYRGYEGMIQNDIKNLIPETSPMYWNEEGHS